MGDVGIIYKILPEDLEVNVEDLMKRIEEQVKDMVKIKGMQIKPIAFGLNAILMYIIVKDEAGITEKFEEKVKSIKGVGEIEVEEMSLL